MSAAIAERARKASALLAPQDPVVRSAWLFAKDWVEESAEEIAAEDLDFTKRDERIDAGRRSAMHDIWSQKSFDGGRNMPDPIPVTVIARSAVDSAFQNKVLVPRF